MGLARRTSEFGRPLDAELVQVDGTTAEAPLATPAGTRSALMSVSGEAVMYRVDGTSPTSAVGHLVQVGDFVELGAADLIDFEVISISATPANVFITYYGD